MSVFRFTATPDPGVAHPPRRDPDLRLLDRQGVADELDTQRYRLRKKLAA